MGEGLGRTGSARRTDPQNKTPRHRRNRLKIRKKEKGNVMGGERHRGAKRGTKGDAERKTGDKGRDTGRNTGADRFGKKKMKRKREREGKEGGLKKKG